MAKTKAVGLRNNTMKIMNNFFEYIDNLKCENKSSYQINLAAHVKQFFDEMNQLGEQEFALFLRKHQFENTDPVQQLKYTDAFNCLVAFIVAEYSESDLLRYFIPRVYSAEDKPAPEPSSSGIVNWSQRLVYWAKLLTYWLASKLFDRQKFKINESKRDLQSAIKEIKEAFRDRESNYFDLQQNNVTFNENLQIVVGKFVENRNKTNASIIDDRRLRSTASPDTVFIKEGFVFKPSTSEQPSTSAPTTPQSTSFTTSIVPPPPPSTPFSPPILKAAAVPSTSTVSEPASNDKHNLLTAIRKGIELKSVKPDEKLPADSKINDSNDLVSALKAVLSERRKVIQDDSEKNLDENNGEDWVDGPSVIETFHFGLLDDGQLENVMLKLEHLLPDDFSKINLVTVMENMKKALQSAGVEVYTKEPIAIASEVQPKKNAWQSFFSFGNPQSQQPAKNPSSQESTRKNCI